MKDVPSETAKSEHSMDVSSAEPSEYELQMRGDFKRYTYLREELKKLPVKDIDQWHNEGKLTEDQYNKFVDTYIAIQSEMEDIRKRVRVMNQTSAYQKPEPQETQVNKKEKKPGRVARVVAWVSSLLLVVCVAASGVTIYNLSTDNDKYKKLYSDEEKALEECTSYYSSSLKAYRELEDLYDSTWDELRYYQDKYWYLKTTIDSKLKIGDARQTVINKCGSPTLMQERFKSWGSEDGWTWYYGTSYVLIDTNDRVEGWYIGDTPLPVE